MHLKFLWYTFPGLYNLAADQEEEELSDFALEEELSDFAEEEEDQQLENFSLDLRRVLNYKWEHLDWEEVPLLVL